MDQIKIGRFIAKLRKEKGLTQEKLGESLGVTNKTVSRWENGNYMPDIEMMQLLGAEFGVSINELLAGERLDNEAFRAKAEENIVEISRKSAFTFEERRKYFREKWKKDNLFGICLCVIIGAVSFIAPLLLDSAWIAASPVVCIGLYGYMNNRMMTYIENNLYGNDRK